MSHLWHLIFVKNLTFRNSAGVLICEVHFQWTVLKILAVNISDGVISLYLSGISPTHFASFPHPFASFPQQICFISPTNCIVSPTNCCISPTKCCISPTSFSFPHCNVVSLCQQLFLGLILFQMTPHTSSPPP